MAYQSFLIQKLQGTNTPVRASDKDYGIYVRKMPFRLYPDMKEVPVRSWPDEQGDDEYIPESPVFKAYTMDVEMVYKGAVGTANGKITGFLDYLAKGGSFTIYDIYTGIGRTDVRYSGYQEDAFYRKEGEMEVVEFTVKLKVNNPLENKILEYNAR